MRNLSFVALVAVLAGAGPAAAAEPTPERLSRYFSSWYSFCPETRVTVAPVADLSLAGFETYRVERSCVLKNRNDMSITLFDPAEDEVFVGDLLHDDTRKGRPFSEAADLPILDRILADAYGIPASVAIAGSARGPLKPIKASLRLAEGATVPVSGFVSEDGATLLLGQFRPLGVAPDELRRRMLAESPGVRPKPGNYYVTAFIDFQCEKCRQRTPRIADFASTHGGGAVEYRFLPMIKVHDRAFAAAETAAALANVSPPLYARYEQTVFAQAASMTEASVRQAGADVAEAAGVGPAFREELSSGRARQRVAKDVELAMRLGLNGTPMFFYDGTLLTSEIGLAENYIDGRLRKDTGSPATPGGRR